MKDLHELKTLLICWLDVYHIVLNTVKNHIDNPAFDQELVQRDISYWTGRINSITYVLQAMDEMMGETENPE